MYKNAGNGLAGGQIVPTVLWQQKVDDCSKKLQAKTINTGVPGDSNFGRVVVVLIPQDPSYFFEKKNENFKLIKKYFFFNKKSVQIIQLSNLCSQNERMLHTCF